MSLKEKLGKIVDNGKVLKGMTYANLAGLGANSGFAYVAAGNEGNYFQAGVILGLATVNLATVGLLAGKLYSKNKEKEDEDLVTTDIGPLYEKRE